MNSTDPDVLIINARCRAEEVPAVLSLPLGKLCALTGGRAPAVAWALQRESARRYHRLVCGGTAPASPPHAAYSGADRVKIEIPGGLPLIHLVEGDFPFRAGTFRKKRTVFAPADSLAELFNVPALLIGLFAGKGTPWCDTCGRAARTRSIEEQLAGLAGKSGGVLALAVPVEEEASGPKLACDERLQLYGAEYVWKGGVLFKGGVEATPPSGEMAVVIATAGSSSEERVAPGLAQRARELFQAGIEKLLLLRVGEGRRQAEPLGYLSTRPVCPCCGRGFDPVSRQVLEHRLEGALCGICCGTGMAAESQSCPGCRGSGVAAPFGAWNLAGARLDQFASMSFGELRDWARGCEGCGADAASLRRSVEALCAFGFGDYLLSHPLSVISPGERYRARLALLMLAGPSESLVILNQNTSPLGDDEFCECVAAMDGLRHSDNTMVVIPRENSACFGFEWVGRADWREDRLVLCGAAVEECAREGKGRKFAGSRTAQIEYAQAGGEFVEVQVGFTGQQAETLRLPVGGLIMVSGRSGIGKTRLLEQLFRDPGLREHFGKIERLRPVSSAREACLASLAGLYPDIVELIAGTRESRLAGYDRVSFSLSASPFRCPRCKGMGAIFCAEGDRLEDDPGSGIFSDLLMECPRCMGSRFEPELLQIRYRDLSIAGILALSLKQAQNCFWDQAQLALRLELLCSLGFEQTALGKGRLEMCPGEISLLRLFLSVWKYLIPARAASKVIFLLDTPMAGLDAMEARAAFELLNRLVKKGHTVVCVDKSYLQPQP